MFTRKSGIAALFTAVCLLVAIGGCEGPEGPQGPPGTSPVYINGWIQPHTSLDSSSHAEVEVYNIPEIPNVEINGIPIPLQYSFSWRIPYRFVHLDLPISAGDSTELLVTYTELDGSSGIAKAGVISPGPFEITSSDTSYDTIAVGDSLAVRWSQSDGADIYLVRFDFQFRYTDTSGISERFYCTIDTLMSDVCITFSPTELFPPIAEIGSVEVANGHFQIWAINGPAKEGDEGNITGDGMGFFNGWTSGGSLYILVGGSDSLVNEAEEPPNRVPKLMRHRANSVDSYRSNQQVFRAFCRASFD
jgi:hypothetical protein